MKKDESFTNAKRKLVLAIIENYINKFLQIIYRLQNL